MRKFYEGKLVRKAIIMILMFSFVGVLIVFYFYFSSLDKLAAINMQQRVMVALEVEAGIQQEILEEYTYWDEAYEQCIEDVDKDWISLNTGDYLFEEQGFDFSMAVRPDGSISYLDAMDKKSIEEYKQSLMGQIDLLLKKVNSSTLSTKVVSGYIALDDQFFLVSAGPFISEKTKRIRTPRSYLIFGKKVDSEYITEIGEKYKLTSLEFARKEKKDDYNLPLFDQENKLIGYIEWNKVYPSREILPFLAMVVSLFYIITGVICMIVLKREAGNIKEQEEQLYFMATKDYLTGASNRRHVMELGQQMLSAHQRNSCSLAVLVLDLDNFKSINDEYGHHTGDRALSTFSRICSQVLRSSDLFGRFGGEEFLAVLHDTEIWNAAEVAERMRRAVEIYSSTDNELPPFTVSIGVAVDSRGDNFDSLIHKADLALFKAKSNGRNRVEVYDENDVCGMPE